MRTSRTAKTTKSKSRQKSISQNAISFINHKYNNRVPLSLLTGLTKTFCKKPIDQNHPFIKRFIVQEKSNTGMNSSRMGTSINTSQSMISQKGKQQTYIDGEKLTQYLTQKTHHEKGKPLTQDAIKRVYQNCCNPEGKLSFEYIMKAAENVGVNFPQKLAKAAVRKFGKNKGFLDVNDCLKIAQKRQQRKNNKSAPNKKR